MSGLRRIATTGNLRMAQMRNPPVKRLPWSFGLMKQSARITELESQDGPHSVRERAVHGATSQLAAWNLFRARRLVCDGEAGARPPLMKASRAGAPSGRPMQCCPAPLQRNQCALTVDDGDMDSK